MGTRELTSPEDAEWLALNTIQQPLRSPLVRAFVSWNHTLAPVSVSCQDDGARLAG